MQVQETSIRAFTDASRDGEVRIAAFITFMSTINCESPVPTDGLRTIVGSVHLERNQQVQTAVYTHLKALENITNPSLKCRYNQMLVRTTR